MSCRDQRTSQNQIPKCNQCKQLNTIDENKLLDQPDTSEDEADHPLVEAAEVQELKKANNNAKEATIEFLLANCA